MDNRALSRGSEILKEKLVKMRNIQITELKNGLRVISERVPQVESVALGIWIIGGMVIEPDRVLGISHYLEHMLFKGTRRRSARQISEEMDSVGGHLNGYTDRENTCLYANLLGEHLPLAVDLILDMALDSRFDPKDIEMEREVIIQESRRLEDNPEEYVHDLAVETAWRGHPLGRSIHGNEKTIRAISRADLLRHFRTSYKPDRMLVAAAGAVAHDRLVKLIAKSTGGMKPGRPQHEQSPPAFHSGERRLRRSSEQVNVCLTLPGCSHTDEDRYALSLCDTILGGCTSSRLFQEIRENRGLAYSIGSYSHGVRNGGLFLIHTGTGPRNLKQVLDLTRRELARFRKAGATEEELVWAKSHVRGSLALARESTSFRMQRLAHAMLYEGKVISYRALQQRFDRVTVEDTRRVAERFFSVEPALIVMGPVK